VNAKKLFSGLGGGYVLFMVLIYLFQLLLTLPFALLKKEPQISVMMLISEVAMYGCAFPVLYLWLKRFPKWELKRNHKMPLKDFLLWLLFSYGISYIANLASQFLMYAVAAATGITKTNPVDQMIQTLTPVSLFFYVVIVAPLMEELIFRKLLIDRMIPYGQKAAVIVSGVAFGLFHGNFFQFFYACILGMIFAYLYTETGTMWYGVMIHGAINFTGGFLSLILQTEVAAGSIPAMMWMQVFGLFVLMCMFLAIILISKKIGRITFYPGWAEDSGPGLWKRVLPAPGVILYVIMCVLLFIFT